MADKTRHAFGSRENLSAAIASGKVNAFDILMMSGENESPSIGWIDPNGALHVVESGGGSGGEATKEIIRVDALPTENVNPDAIYIYNNSMYIWGGEEFVSTSVSAEIIQDMIKEYSDSIIDDVTNEDIENLFT